MIFALSLLSSVSFFIGRSCAIIDKSSENAGFKVQRLYPRETSSATSTGPTAWATTNMPQEVSHLGLSIGKFYA
jgi:hypothetical protein